MRKLSSILILFVAVIIIALPITSCTRKMGCYFGLSNDLNRTTPVVSTVLNPEGSHMLISHGDIPISVRNIEFTSTIPVQ
ncbi:MAG: hypothetical protein IPP15_01695 [Saprospiraceae bacterium]|uniref:Uncharacterized protein n=1 Tax=Candidatus Opimibacter skivensis TaxID=2982028 RepID=A0A9D7SQ12_9BACT|nr:hypothetical protein [Candidatus Opimibacter skivensis]